MKKLMLLALFAVASLSLQAKQITCGSLEGTMWKGYLGHGLYATIGFKDDWVIAGAACNWAPCKYYCLKDGKTVKTVCSDGQAGYEYDLHNGYIVCAGAGDKVVAIFRQIK